MKRTLRKFIAAGIWAAVFLISQWNGVFQNMEYQLQDVHYQNGNLTNPNICVIGIDEETLMEYGLWNEWGREKIAELVCLLNEDKNLAPAVIGLDIGFYAESAPEIDQILVDASAKCENVVVSSYATFGKQILEKADGNFEIHETVQTYEVPFEGLREVVSWGFSNVPLDEDGVVRHTLTCLSVDEQTEFSFASEIYHKYVGKYPEMELSYIPFSGYPYDYYGSETAGLSLCKVLSGDIPKEFFAGNIVLVGAYSPGLMDSYYTSISRNIPMHGVEIHANILQALLEENKKTELNLWSMMAVTASVLVLVFFLWNIRDMRIASAAAAVLCVGYWFMTRWVYELGYVMPILYPMLALILGYMVRTGFQYVRERVAKKRVESIFGRYVSQNVVDSILKGGEEALKLGGQKKDIAVLFVDIRGFTPLSETLLPEQVVNVLNQYLEITTKSVFNNGGTIDKFIGDATMALFNAPLDQDDYVFRAVKAGLDMVDRGQALEKRLEELAGKKISFGIGIHCGEAVIGNIGTSKRMDYTAIGSTVNLAARLESQAKAGEILISPEIYERLKDRIQVKSIGLCTLKGIAEPIEIFSVIGLKK